MRYIGVNPNLSGLAIRGTVREAAALPNLSIRYILKFPRSLFGREPGGLAMPKPDPTTLLNT